jgi:polyhydroxybutyrate depolymerase
MNSVAADYTWFTMHPVGTTAELDKGGSYGWNAEGCCPTCYDREIDDFAFANAMMDWAEANLCVDMSHVFTTGFSNGGFMAYSVACKLGHRLAGAAANAGSISKGQLSKCNQPALGALPVVSFHSLADTYVPYDGNVVDASQPEVDKMFEERASCSGEKKVRRGRQYSGKERICTSILAERGRIYTSILAERGYTPVPC